MATYEELSTIQNNADYNVLLNKIQVACAVKASAIIDSATPAAEALEWAKGAIASPNAAGRSLVAYVIASNKAATLAQIYAASDTAIQTNVDDAVDAVYGS